jgi:hypothetical protein
MGKTRRRDPIEWRGRMRNRQIQKGRHVGAGVVVRLITVVALVLIPARGAEWLKKFEGPAPALLRLETVNGNVLVRGGDISWIEVRVTTRGWSIGPGGVQVLDRREGDVLDVGVQGERDFFGIGERSIELDVTVPRQMNVTARTGEGKITADHFGGDVKLATDKGGIEALWMDGALDARSGDGPVHFSGRFDRLNVRTPDGEVRGEIEAGSAIAAKAEWRINNGNGPIHLQIPSGLKCNLHVGTFEGQVTVDLPAAGVSAAGVPGLRAKVNGGGGVFSVKARGGNVEIGAGRRE